MLQASTSTLEMRTLETAAGTWKAANPASEAPRTLKPDSADWSPKTKPCWSLLLQLRAVTSLPPTPTTETFAGRVRGFASA